MEIRALRGGTTAAFGVNLFVPGDPTMDEEAVRAYLDTLRPDADRLGVALGEPRFDDDGWDDKIALLVDESIPVVSFTFGCPPVAVVQALHDVGTEVWVTATSPDEARRARDAGADVVVLKGIEAGGHRASWVDTDDAEGLSILALVRLVASQLDVPLVGAGGIVTAPCLRASLPPAPRLASSDLPFFSLLRQGRVDPIGTRSEATLPPP
jgi:nitronate monooxygenase